MFRIATILIAVTAIGLLSGCVSRTPFFLSGNATTIELEPKDVVIKGPTQGTSSAMVLFGIQFGTPSYLEAEEAALKAGGGDVLIDRVRYDGFEGIGLQLGRTPLHFFGSRTYYVQGVAAKYTR